MITLFMVTVNNPVYYEHESAVIADSLGAIHSSQSSVMYYCVTHSRSEAASVQYGRVCHQERADSLRVPEIETHDRLRTDCIRGVSAANRFKSINFPGLFLNS